MTSDTFALRQSLKPGLEQAPEFDSLRIIDGGSLDSLADSAVLASDEIPPESQRDEDRDDEQNPDAAIIAHPEWDVSTMLSAATFDTSVPAAVMAAQSTIYQTLNFNGLFSLDPYSLADFFKQNLGEIGDDGKPKDEDDNLSIYADIVAEEKAERRREQEDVAATLSEDQIDAIPWVGDPNEVVTFGNIAASRKEWLAGAKSTRTRIKQKVANGEMSEADAAHETRLISDWEIAMKEKKYEKAANSNRKCCRTRSRC